VSTLPPASAICRERTHRRPGGPLLLSLLLPVALAGPPAPAPSAAPERVEYSDASEQLLAEQPFSVHARVVTLDNGLRVVVEHQDRTDQLAVHLHVGVGSRDEAPGEHGLAHLFEHLMYEGSRNAPGNAYDTLVTEAGGQNNAYTTHDETAYHAVVPSGALERMLFLESDRLGFLAEGITDKAVNNQIDVVLQEREQSYATVHGKDLDTLQQLLYPPEHPYHRPVIGTEADVRGFTVDTARAFHRRFYRPSNVVLVIVGPVEPDHVIERVKHWFSDVPDRSVTPRARPTELPHHATTQRGLLADNVDDFTVYLAWYGVPLGHPDEAALVVASYLLSDGRGTRIDRHYYRKGWVTDSDTRSWSSELDGEFFVSMSSDKPRVGRLERILRREVRGLIRRPPTPAELDRAKRRIRSTLLDRLEDPADRAEVLVDCVRLTDDPDCTARDWERVRQVSADDVVRALERLGEPSAMLLVAPSSQATDLDDDLEYVEPM